jgi:hypothetical protein
LASFLPVMVQPAPNRDAAQSDKVLSCVNARRFGKVSYSNKVRFD